MRKPSSLGTRLVGGILATLFGVAHVGAQCEPSKWNLPKRFPIDAFVLSVIVEEPAHEDASGESALQARLLHPVHVPERRERWEIRIRAAENGCPGRILEEAELLELYARGDELLMVGYPLPGGQLETFTDWVAYGAQLRLKRVQSFYDYASTLFRLEAYEKDTDRILPLRSIAEYVESPDEFRQVLDAQLRSRNLRRRMMKVHEGLQADGSGS